MSPSETHAVQLHAIRSTLARLRYEVELAESLTAEDRGNILRAVEDLARLSEVEPGAAGAAGRRMHVAVVDDDERLATLIGRSLERLGYRVTASQTPDATLDCDAWVVDWSVLKGCSEGAPRVDRTILMSGNQLQLSGGPFAGCPVLLKPFVVSQLVAELSNLDLEG